MDKYQGSRRKFIKAAAYTAPVILSLKAAPTFAKSGSIIKANNGCGQEKRGLVDGVPPGLQNKPGLDFNDGVVIGECTAKDGYRPFLPN